jgi:hypothetical protein
MSNKPSIHYGLLKDTVVFYIWELLCSSFASLNENIVISKTPQKIGIRHYVCGGQLPFTFVEVTSLHSYFRAMIISEQAKHNNCTWEGEPKTMVINVNILSFSSFPGNFF